MMAGHRLPTEFWAALVSRQASITLEEVREKLGSRPTGFASRIRTLRVGAGLTQAELAESAGVSERTISDLERGLRTTIYPATARQLAVALNIGGDELASFLTEARGRDRGPALPEIAPLPSEQRSRLPVPLTRLLGRKPEVAAVLALIRDSGTRLATLVGPGGIGKTRIAIEVAASAEVDFPGGTSFVSLSDADDPEMVLPLIATAVGLPPVSGNLHQALAQRFSEGRALVVLDTFEHLVAAAPAVARLLEAAPELTLLATSRIPLHLRGEREVPVLPLPVGRDPGEAAPAVELFLERAAAVAPGLDTSTAATGLVVEICARVDGVPLAIELAAARTKHMSLNDLKVQLDHRLEPLVGGARDLPARQRTMRGTHDWSYALLGAAEMRQFRCLAALRGTFGRDAAEMMTHPVEASAPTDIVDPLSILVDSSLVAMEPGATGEPRYRLLDITREYAVERSVMAGEFDALRRRHADYFLAQAELAEPELRGRNQQQWHARLSQDEANFRAALTWALEAGQGEVALRMGAALWMFWRWAGLFAEGRSWLEAALTAGHDSPLELRCQAYWGAGWLAFHAGDYKRTGEVGEEMLRLLSGRDGGLERRNGLTLVGNAALATGRDDAAIATYGEALAICSKLGTSWHLATSYLNLGTAERQSGRGAEARAHFESALAIYQELGDRHFAARILLQLGYAALSMGQPADAAKHIEQAMETIVQLGDGWSMAEGLEAEAALHGESDPRLAALLGGAAERLRERIAMRPHPADARLIKTQLDRAQAQLPGSAFDDFWDEGRSMALDAVLGLALK
jgi:predicted ATPase/transcriptional regulator with XRE-family HTH domain